MEQFMAIMVELGKKGEQCLQDIDNWHKAFEEWRDCLLDDMERMKTQKDPRDKVVPLIPVTPAASYKKRTRRKLSAVRELGGSKKIKSADAKSTSVKGASTSGNETFSVDAGEKTRRRAAKNASCKLASMYQQEQDNSPIRKSKRACVTRENSALTEGVKETATRSQSTRSRETTESSSDKKNEELVAVPSTVSGNEQISCVSEEAGSVEAKEAPLNKAVKSSLKNQETGTSLCEGNEMPSTGKQSAVKNIESSNKDPACEAISEKLSSKTDEEKTSNLCDELSLNEKKAVKKSLRVICKRVSAISKKSVRKVSKVRQSSQKVPRMSNQRMTRQTFKKLSQASCKKSVEKPSMITGENTGNSEESNQIDEMVVNEGQNNKEKIEQGGMENEEEMETNGSDDESNYCSADEGNSIMKTNKINNVPVQLVISDKTEETPKLPANIPVQVSGKDLPSLKPANTKSPALFSPYAQEPVKNRVAAYETLHSVPEEPENDAAPVRMTRTKARALAAKAAAPKNEEMQKLAKGTKIDSSNGAAKENFGPSVPKSIAGKGTKPTQCIPSKVLSQNNSQLSQSALKKTPMSNSALLSSFITSSTGQLSRINNKPGVILSNIHSFIKKKPKPDVDSIKLEEQKKRQEKEKEAQRRKEEFLKKKAEDQKKWDEKRLKVLQNREAQVKEKQESQLRMGREKTEKMNNLLQQREAKQKEEILQKKIEAERKAAEARRKHEEAEAARIAKLRLQEEQRRKEQEETEAQRQGVKRAAEEREAAAKREKLEPAATLTMHVDANEVPPVENLNATFTKSKSNTKNNVFYLNEIDTDESSSDESARTKTSASWAKKPLLLHNSELELDFHRKAQKFFSCPKGSMDLQKIFNSHVKRDYKRTSSAVWHTPPRYSQLPKY